MEPQGKLLMNMTEITTSVQVVMAYVVMAYVVMAYAGRIGSRQQRAKGVSWGCPGGAQRSCGDHLHPIQLGFNAKS